MITASFFNKILLPHNIAWIHINKTNYAMTFLVRVFNPHVFVTRDILVDEINQDFIFATDSDMAFDDLLETIEKNKL